MKRDLNEIAAIERAIEEKYGREATVNPAGNWDPEKEKKYIEDVKLARKKEADSERSQEFLDLEGVLIPKKLINKNTSRECNFCKKYSFNRDDDVFLTKYSSCTSCYIQHIEGREHKWQKD